MVVPFVGGRICPRNGSSAISESDPMGREGGLYGSRQRVDLACVAVFEWTDDPVALRADSDSRALLASANGLSTLQSKPFASSRER